VSPDEALDALIDYVRAGRCVDLGSYKRGTVERRVTRRRQDVGVPTVADYLDFLEVHPEELSRLLDALLINVTGFFRDPPAWEYFASEVVPQIVATKGPRDAIRVWSAGCASGEESYTAAMILAEALGVEAFRERVKVYATDADESALARARQGVYRVRDLDPVPPALRERYFVEAGDRLAFRPDLRRAVIFGRHDLLQHAPISRLDVLICRNVLMYFNTEAQDRILSRFHFALGDPGFLFLGRAEMLLNRVSLFRPVDLRHRIFGKLTVEPARNHPGRPVPDAGPETGAESRLSDAAFRWAPVAQIVVDGAGRLALANDQARALFGLHADDVGRAFHDLELSYRPLELRSLIQQALAERGPFQQAGVAWQRPGAQTLSLDVQVVPLLDIPNPPLGVIVVFHDVTGPTTLREELRRAHAQLERAYEELQSTNEELETTNEELQSANEELETTNEELQSANEELETMNEELQSSNEELQTLNDELRLRTDDLNAANAFLESILAGLRVGVVVLDERLAVQVWNPKAEGMWGLRADEVRGKPLLSLDIGLPLAELGKLVQTAVEGRAEEGGTLFAATNRRGKTIRCRVRTAPRVGAEGRRHGLILLMEEEPPAAAPAEGT
jgi:two-component system CheB/CheR fusion protein